MNDPTHIAHSYGPKGEAATSLHLFVSDESLVQFRNILQRALNCAPPHDPQYADWFVLADLLEDKKEIKGESQGV